MSREDLHLVPFIGELRARVLKNSGIEDVQKLLITPLEKLAELDGFSIKIAQKIKNYSAELERRGLLGKAPIKELLISEDRCPRCRAIVSRVESHCHRCNLRINDVSVDVEEAIVANHFEILAEPFRSELWKKRALLLESVGAHSEAEICNMQAEMLEMFGSDVKERKRVHEKFQGIIDSDGISVGKGLVGGLKSTRVKKKLWVGAVILIIFMFFSIILTSVLSTRMISIDGKFEDWTEVPSIPIYGEIVREVKFLNQEKRLMMYVEFFENMLSLRETKDFLIEILLDTDLRSSTGYAFDGLGVDKIIVFNFSLAEGNSIEAPCLTFVKLNDTHRWIKEGYIKAKTDGKRVEFSLTILKFYGVILYRDNLEELISSVFSTEYGIFCIARDGDSRVINEKEVVCTYLLYSINGKPIRTEIRIENLGTAKRAQFKLVTREGKVVEPGLSLTVGKISIVDVVYMGGGRKGETVYIKPHIKYAHTYKDFMRGRYIASLPESVVFDGIYADWKYYNDSGDCACRDCDIENVGVCRINDACLLISFSVRGELFRTRYSSLFSESKISLIRIKVRDLESNAIRSYEIRALGRSHFSASENVEIKHNDKYAEILIFCEIGSKYTLELYYSCGGEDNYIHEETASLAR